ncbi:ParB/RepB/Spo0J family partition protein [Streptomyces sp. NPDC056682]|uniref:ParB/RepB/Spo0J family partition protein n=1 Tax=Streptomyces sp. NPDC056682 TaxID=3345909 RepID=UPI0036B50C38
MSTATGIRPDAVEGFAGRFVWVDPHDLVVDPYNHRKNRADQDGEDTTQPDPELQASVDELGVLTPLVLRPQEGEREGKLGIIFGQRRNNAALAAANKAKAMKKPYRLVPAIIRDDLAGVDDAALTVSFIENKHRRQATVRDDIEAARQLSLMTIPKARKIRNARAMGFKPAELGAASKAAQLSDKSLAEAIEEDFNLVELAEFQEVEGVEDALWTLKRAKTRDQREDNTKRGHWKHALADLRAEKELNDKRAERAAELTAAEVTIVDWRWNWSDTTTRPLTDLLTDDGAPHTPQTHQTCPGHAACVNPSDAEVIWLCTAWHRHGHPLTADAATKDTSQAGPDKEAAKAERRLVIANNKAWRQAREVRADFIKDLCQQPEASTRVWPLILSMITGTSYAYENYISRKRTDLTARFLGVEDPNEGNNQWTRVGDPFGAVIARTSPGRVWRVLLAHVAAAYEVEHMDDAAWRNHINVQTVAWLTFLQTEGYALSTVEAETVAKGRAQQEEQDVEARQDDEQGQGEDAGDSEDGQEREPLAAAA